MLKGFIAGNLGLDAELKHTQGGDEMLSFSVAVEVREGKEKATQWVRCTLWGKRGAALGQYLTKGTKVAVSGGLTVRQYDGAKGPGVSLEMRVDDVTLMGGKQEGGGREPLPF